MRRGIFIGLIFLLPILGIANSGAETKTSAHTSLKSFLSTSSHSSESLKAFEAFVHKLDRKRASFKSEQDFIQYIFSKTHNRFLKNYAAYASLEETFENGSYNCLSGTILLSLILNHFNIQHEAIETNYHIFIVVQSSAGKILLEATDPDNGFVNSASEIEERIALYKQNEIQVDQTDKAYYKFKFELFNSLTLDELRGLLYYNMSVNSFNQQELQKSVQHFVKAQELYTSPRMDEFSQVLILSLQQSCLEQKTKENCMSAILSSRQKSLPLMLAANN